MLRSVSFPELTDLPMKRRTFVAGGLAITAIGKPLMAALDEKQVGRKRSDPKQLDEKRLEDAAGVLKRATEQKQVAVAVLHVRQGDTTFTRAFGKARDENA